jgi:peroxiredoxin
MFRFLIIILSLAAGVVATTAAVSLLPARKTSPAPSVDSRPLAEAANHTLQKLPDYRLFTLDEKELPSQEISRGRVLLFYMNTGCEACAKEVGVVSRLARDASKDLRVYGVGFESPGQLAAFVKESGIEFPVVVDGGSRLMMSLDINRFPTKLLVEDGVIKRVWYGTTVDEAEFRHQLGIGKGTS